MVCQWTLLRALDLETSQYGALRTVVELTADSKIASLSGNR